VTSNTKTYDLADLPNKIRDSIEWRDPDSHWIWEGNYHPDGLPLIGSRMAHSTIYRHLNPELPSHAGRIFRTCGEKKCVNPAHMRCPTVENGGLSGRVPKAEGVQKVQKIYGELDSTGNSEDLVKVLQRIAEVLERIEVKVK